MKSILDFINKNGSILGIAGSVLTMAFLFWAQGYFVTKEAYEKDTMSVERHEEISRTDIKEINLKLNVIIEGQKALQSQFAAQNVLNEQFKEQYKDLHERLRYLERKEPVK
jgi:hypothetical protein